MDLQENQIMEVGSYKIIFKQIDVTSTSEHTKYSTLIEVFDDKNNSVQLVPYFVVSNKKAEAMVEMFPAVGRIGLNDIYIEPIDYFMNTRTDIYTEFQQNLVFPKLRINFFIKPFIIFVWLGGILLISGFCILLFSSRQSV
jgi:cytochrome c biogenesis factor